ncbi:multiple antibiotic resistance regulatory protein MarB, partial [Escherichia coli]
MKPLLSAIAAALILFSAQGFAEQTQQPLVTS